MRELATPSGPGLFDPEFDDVVIRRVRSPSKPNHLSGDPHQEFFPVAKRARNLAANVVALGGLFKFIAKVLDPGARRHEQIDGNRRVKIAWRERLQTSLNLAEIIYAERRLSGLRGRQTDLLAFSQGHVNDLDAATADDEQRLHQANGPSTRFRGCGPLSSTGRPKRPDQGRRSGNGSDCIPVEEVGEIRPPVPPRCQPSPNLHSAPPKSQ